MLCSHEGRFSARYRQPQKRTRQATPAPARKASGDTDTVKPGYSRQFRARARSARYRLRWA
ncbi:hypothetical protein SAMN06295900_11781 [Trinickia caryophylli]|uniref:Uncharacterized protein n=1 Tax=Trinickia caryophylli TaxID=28094 RepID=A0A1X7GR59_TRICW|nr:hypothetical protein SAMN06295900_11781 [Trinickia caryophylli]